MYNKFKEFSGNEEHLDKNQTYKMFMMIHGLATNTNQDINEDEMSELIENDKSSFIQRNSNIDSSRKEKDITLNRFDYIYKNRINPSLDEEG